MQTFHSFLIHPIMANKNTSFLSIVILVFLLSTQLACSKNDDTTPAATVSLKLATNATFGKILTDSNGRALYFFASDVRGDSGCTGGCITTWPIFYKANATFGEGLTASDFGTITRIDGAQQTTYKGWPIYYYKNDVAAGDVKGDKVGTTWFVAKPDYTLMVGNGQLIGNNGIEYDGQYAPGKAKTQYLTDPYGRALYAFKPDKFKKNTYTKPDLSNNATWPIFETTPVQKIFPSTFTASDFDTLAVFGKIQLTFKGWPIYYFGSDQMIKGNTKGVSVPTPGTWPIVNNNSAAALP
jgi:predicted lipoprotein with Yx(FWY)xxD motif